MIFQSPDVGTTGGPGEGLPGLLLLPRVPRRSRLPPRSQGRPDRWPWGLQGLGLMEGCLGPVAGLRSQEVLVTCVSRPRRSPW